MPPFINGPQPCLWHLFSLWSAGLRVLGDSCRAFVFCIFELMFLETLAPSYHVVPLVLLFD